MLTYPILEMFSIDPALPAKWFQHVPTSNPEREFPGYQIQSHVLKRPQTTEANELCASSFDPYHPISKVYISKKCLCLRSKSQNHSKMTSQLGSKWIKILSPWVEAAFEAVNFARR